MKKNTTSLIWPKPLRTGDKVALTAPSSPVSPESLDTAVSSLKALELEPVIMPSCSSHKGYLAGSDRLRAEDFNCAFSTDDIKAVFCLRGGYGAMRILPLIDFNMIKSHPKIMIGYSDITALHTAINNYCEFITFHGPMPNIGYELLDDYSLNSLKHVLFHERERYSIINPPGEHIGTLMPGCAEGMLVGGNLSLLAGTLGSPYEIDTCGKLLFIEEVNEVPYKLDRALTSLSLAGKFKNCKGIILGTFTGCENSETNPYCDDATGNSVSDILDTIKEIILPWRKPTFFNLRAGHIYPQCTLPIGAQIRVESDNNGTVNISVL